MPNPEKPGDPDDIFEEIFAREDKRKEELGNKLKEAKDNRPAWKETFSLEELKKFYSPTHGSVFSDIPVTDEMVKEFELAYFLKYPETKNMEELAGKLLQEDYGDIG